MSLRPFVLASLLLVPLPLAAQPQSHADTQPSASAGLVTHVFYLTNAAGSQEANDVVTSIRNIIDPNVRLFLSVSQSALVVRGTPDQIQLVTQLLAELDHPRKSYRLTYTVTTYDNKERIGTERFGIVLVTGQHAVIKQGSKVPIVTGTYKPENGAADSQVTYLDIGMNFDATLDEFSSGVRLRSKVEQSSIAPEQSSVGAADPVVRQTVLEGTSVLTPNKPLILGSLDIPGSTRHLDITVTMEPAV